MILKVLSCREDKTAHEEWDFFDNIVSAKSYFDENIKLKVVYCQFRDGNEIEFIIHNVAYLMNDEGKTIERIATSDTVAAAVESKNEAKF